VFDELLLSRVTLVLCTLTSDLCSEGRYKMMASVSVSVWLSVCLLTLKQKGLGSPKLAGWKPITWVNP